MLGFRGQQSRKRGMNQSDSEPLGPALSTYCADVDADMPGEDGSFRLYGLREAALRLADIQARLGVLLCGGT